MKHIALFLVAVVVVCVIIAKLTGLHDETMRVRGTSGQINRYPTRAEVYIDDGKRGVYCEVDKKFSMVYGTKVVAEGSVKREQRFNLISEETDEVIVLRECKISRA